MTKETFQAVFFSRNMFNQAESGHARHIGFAAPPPQKSVRRLTSSKIFFFCNGLLFSSCPTLIFMSVFYVLYRVINLENGLVSLAALEASLVLRNIHEVIEVSGGVSHQCDT